MKWIREAISDSQTGKASMKRVAMLIASIALATSLVILAAAAFVGREVALAMGAVAGPLAGLAGYGYVNGKTAELKRTVEAK